MEIFSYIGDVAELPPEFRSAGLTAQMQIKSGKIFGPFSGVISSDDHRPKPTYILVCQVNIPHNDLYMQLKL